MSTERIIVVEAVADAFAGKLADKAGHANGDRARAARRGRSTMTPRSACSGLIDDALGQGRRALAGGDAAVLMPRPCRRVTPAMKSVPRRKLRARSSGSSASHDEEEAIRVANDSDYGLSAAVFTRDAARGLRVARQIRSGICHVNGPTVHDEPQMPFGGIGASGYGRFGGKAGIEAFTELRWITIAGEPGHYPI